MTNNIKGFTLVEFLVAIVILMVGMLGMLQSINVAMDTNLENVFRTEAVMVADDLMMQKRAMAFDLITGIVPKSFVSPRNIRGIMKNYSVWTTVSLTTPRSKEIDINIRWKKKGDNYSHSASSVVSTY